MSEARSFVDGLRRLDAADTHRQLVTVIEVAHAGTLVGA